MVDEKAFDKMVERALLQVFSKALQEKENNPFNTAIFGSPEFLQIYQTMVKVARIANDATSAVNDLMSVIQKQQKQINDLAGAVELILNRFEADAEAERAAVADLLSAKKPEKPN